MNIVLIHPYISSLHLRAYQSEPLGLICLATYLESCFADKISVSILDLFVLGWQEPRWDGTRNVIGVSEPDEIADLLKKASPDLVGIHCNFTAYSEDAFRTAALVKKSFSELPVVMGGAHVSMDPAGIMSQRRYIDYIVRGEGEVTLKELVTALMQGDREAIKNIDGLCYRNGDGTVVLNADRELIPDLNELPIPDRRFVDMEEYKKINLETLPFTKKRPVANIMTSRGCPFNCIFCSTKIMWKRHWRPISPERVMMQIEGMVRDYGIQEIAIQDDQFLLDKQRVMKICDYLIERKLGITLSVPSGMSIWLVDEELLRRMKDAGFYRLSFSIETGNSRTMKFIRKPVNLDEARDKIRMANRMGFWTQGNFIIGFPYETREEIMDTIQYAYNSGLDYTIFYVAKPYAGSEMYEIFKKEGLLKEIVQGSHIVRSDYDTTTMTADELNKIHTKAVKRLLIHKLFFYLNPRNFWTQLFPKLRRWEDICYAVRVVPKILRLRQSHARKEPCASEVRANIS